MSKQRRTVLSGVVTPFSPPPAEELPEAYHELSLARRKAATIQQTVYLPPGVHDQLRELAFAERVKMHSLLTEGLALLRHDEPR